MYCIRFSLSITLDSVETEKIVQEPAPFYDHFRNPFWKVNNNNTVSNVLDILKTASLTGNLKYNEILAILEKKKKDN